MKKKPVSPSKVKYDKSHPVVSIRVDPELKEDLQLLRLQGGKSVGDILREALGKQIPATEKAYRLGFETAQGCFRVIYHCSVCGGTTVLQSEQEKQAAAQYMREHGWHHGNCKN